MLPPRGSYPDDSIARHRRKLERFPSLFGQTAQTIDARGLQADYLTFRYGVFTRKR